MTLLFVALRRSAVLFCILYLGVLASMIAGCGGSMRMSPSPSLKRVTISPASAELAAGQTQQFSVFAIYSDGTVNLQTATAQWSAVDSSIATVTSPGVIQAKTAGVTSIAASVSGVTAAVQVTVHGAAPVSISVTPSSLSVPAGEKSQLKVNCTMTDGSVQDVTGSVKWDVADQNVISIDGNGLVAGLKVGTSAFTGSLPASNAKTITVSSSATVTAAQLTGVSISPASAELTAGQTQQFAVSAMYSDGTLAVQTATAQWSAVDPSIATVTSPGVIQAKTAGVTSIVASVGSATATAQVTVHSAAPLSLSVAPSSLSLPAGEKSQLKVSCAMTDGSVQDVTSSVKWDVANSNVISIGGNGLMAGLQAGTSAFTASLPASNSNAKTITVSGSATVTAPQLTGVGITASATNFPVGTSQQLTLTGNYGNGTQKDLTGMASWSSSNSTILSVTANGNAAAVGQGTAVVSAAIMGLQANLSLTADSAALTSIAISPVAPQILSAKTLQLTATGTYTDGSTQDVTSTATWSVEKPAVLELSGNGTVIGLSAGSSGVSATLSGTAGNATVLVRPIGLVSYFSNPAGSPDAAVRFSAWSEQNAQSCMMVYVFNQDQQLAECCGCSISRDGLRTLSLQKDLLANPLTGIPPENGSVMLFPAALTVGSTCDPTTVSPAGSGQAWSTRMQISQSPPSVTETPFSETELSDGLLSGLQAECTFVQQLGSGQGVCTCGTGD